MEVIDNVPKKYHKYVIPSIVFSAITAVFLFHFHMFNILIL
jgi:hypothetical protein